MWTRWEVAGACELDKVIVVGSNDHLASSDVYDSPPYATNVDLRSI